MIIDSLLVFDQGTYVAGAGMIGVAQHASDTTTVSTNVLDMVNPRDMGGGADESPPLTAEIRVTTAYVGGTSVNIQLQGSTDNTTYTTYVESGAIAIAALSLNAAIKLPMPQVNPAGGALPRYYRLQYTFIGNVTAGSVIAWLGTVSSQRYYPPGITVAN